MRASKKVKGAVLLTAGAALILGAPTVYASDNSNNNGNGGLLSGLSVLNGSNLNIPVVVGGLGVLGSGSGNATAHASNGDGGNSYGGGRGGGGNGARVGNVNNDDNTGILSGLSVGNNLNANVPVEVCGAGVLGSGKGKCATSASNGDGGSSYGKGGRGGHAGNGASKGNVNNNRNNGILTGVSALNNVDLNVPVALCGVGVLGRGSGNCDVSASNGDGGSVYGGGKWYRGSDGQEWRDFRGSGSDRREWRENRGGHREVWESGSWHSGGGGNGGSKGDVNNNGNSGLLSGLSLLNNLDANIPVTVCGLAVLGRANCTVDVESSNRDGGNVGHRGNVDPGRYHHEGGDSHDRWENSVLPETGATGLALLPFGLALVAGGVALRRRVASQR